MSDREYLVLHRNRVLELERLLALERASSDYWRGKYCQVADNFSEATFFIAERERIHPYWLDHQLDQSDF